MLESKSNAKHVDYRMNMEQQGEYFVEGYFGLIPSVPMKCLKKKEEADGDYDG